MYVRSPMTIMTSFFVSLVNELREDYELGHTFSKEARDYFKINSASIAVFNSENFYTKHEPKYHVMEFKVSLTFLDVRKNFDKEHKKRLNTVIGGEWSLQSYISLVTINN